MTGWGGGAGLSFAAGLDERVAVDVQARAAVERAALRLQAQQAQRGQAHDPVLAHGELQEGGTEGRKRPERGG